MQRLADLEKDKHLAATAEEILDEIKGVKA